MRRALPTPPTPMPKRRRSSLSSSLAGAVIVVEPASSPAPPPQQQQRERRGRARLTGSPDASDDGGALSVELWLAVAGLVGPRDLLAVRAVCRNARDAVDLMLRPSWDMLRSPLSVPLARLKPSHGDRGRLYYERLPVNLVLDMKDAARRESMPWSWMARHMRPTGVTMVHGTTRAVTAMYSNLLPYLGAHLRTLTLDSIANSITSAVMNRLPPLAALHLVKCLVFLDADVTAPVLQLALRTSTCMITSADLTFTRVHALLFEQGMIKHIGTGSVRWTAPELREFAFLETMTALENADPLTDDEDDDYLVRSSPSSPLLRIRAGPHLRSVRLFPALRQEILVDLEQHAAGDQLDTLYQSHCFLSEVGFSLLEHDACNNYVRFEAGVYERLSDAYDHLPPSTVESLKRMVANVRKLFARSCTVVPADTMASIQTDLQSLTPLLRRVTERICRWLALTGVPSAAPSEPPEPDIAWPMPYRRFPRESVGRKLYMALENFWPMRPLWPFIATCPQLELLMLDGVLMGAPPPESLQFDRLREVWLRPHSSVEIDDVAQFLALRKTVAFLREQPLRPTVYMLECGDGAGMPPLDGCVWVTDARRVSPAAWEFMHEGVHFNEYFNKRKPPAFVSDFLRWLVLEMMSDGWAD